MKKLILILLLLIPSVAGIGVGPAETDLILSPGEETTIELLIKDSSAERVRIAAEGESADYVTLETEEISFADANSRTTEVIISVPENAEPGPKDIKITVQEMKESQSQITVGVKVASRINVMVPYPGKYVRTELVNKKYNPDASNHIVTEVTNFGKEDIDSLKVRINVDGKNIESNVTTLDSKKSKYISLDWTPRRGRFEMEGVTIYDGARTEFSGIAIAGSRKVDISAEPRRVSRESLPLEINLYNNWSASTQVSARAEIRRDGEVITSSPAPIVTLDPHIDGEVQATLDIAELDGDYEVAVIAEYNDKTSERVYDLTVASNKLVFDGKIYNFGISTELMIGIIALALIIIIVVLWRKKRKR